MNRVYTMKFNLYLYVSVAPLTTTFKDEFSVSPNICVLTPKNIHKYSKKK